MKNHLIKKLLPFKWKRQIKEDLGVPSLHWSLQNLKKKGFQPNVVFDIGAYEGFWTLELLEVFPTAKVLMIEAQEKKVRFLQKLCNQFSNLGYAIHLLSSQNDEEKFFFEDETGSYVADSQQTGTILRKTATLDSLILQKKFPLPDLLKLDVQGHEMEVLLGAESCLNHATVCLLELSLLNIGGNTPLLSEMIHFMDEKGFQAYDISQFIRRPYDKALYQIDMFFAKKESFLTNERRW